MLDNLDINIIKALQKDGRVSFVSLASNLGVVEGTIRKRVKKLVGSGIIQISTLYNHSTDNSLLCMIGVQVSGSKRKVADIMARKPEIPYVAFVTGRYDLMIIVHSDSPSELAEFILKEIAVIPGVIKTETFINLDIIKGGNLSIELKRK
ncbi:MAG: Lrp/AsnC family transcriptional regulator [Chloroflexi bacterium]|nr:Lrp/AsnC family transcriptional regulator [Chloroflexota bacterium]